MSTALRNRYVTAALKERRSILAGELRHLEQQIRLATDALTHVDAVLAMYAPEVDAKALPVRVHRPSQPYKVPNLSCRIRDVLRRYGSPMPMGDVVTTLVSEMGFPAEAARAISPSVRYTLRNLAQEHGSVLKTGERETALWSIL